MPTPGRQNDHAEWWLENRVLIINVTVVADRNDRDQGSDEGFYVAPPMQPRFVHCFSALFFTSFSVEIVPSGEYLTALLMQRIKRFSMLSHVSITSRLYDAAQDLSDPPIEVKVWSGPKKGALSAGAGGSREWFTHFYAYQMFVQLLGMLLVQRTGHGFIFLSRFQNSGNQSNSERTSHERFGLQWNKQSKKTAKYRQSFRTRRRFCEVKVRCASDSDSMWPFHSYYASLISIIRIIKKVWKYTRGTIRVSPLLSHKISWKTACPDMTLT